MRYWMNVVRGHYKSLSERLRHLTRAGMTQTTANVVAQFNPKKLTKKKSRGADEFGIFFVPELTDAANKPNQFYCWICRRDVFVLTHYHSETLPHFQGARHSPRDQRLRLDTYGWRVLEYQGKPLTEDKLEQQWDKIRKGPLVAGDRAAEQLITDEAGVTDPNLYMMTKVTSLVQVLQVRANSAPFAKFWS